MRNRAAVKSFLCCAHFLAHQHIPHSTNFKKRVDLVVQCGGHDLKNFLERTGRNDAYTLHVPVVEFIEPLGTRVVKFTEALGTWVGESLLKQFCQASCFSIMADECTDIATMEEMSVFCRWEESGHSEEYFMEIVYLKQANAGSIYAAPTECLKEIHTRRSSSKQCCWNGF